MALRRHFGNSASSHCASLTGRWSPMPYQHEFEGLPIATGDLLCMTDGEEADLHRLAAPVYVVTLLLPASWGTALLQLVMLRGEGINIFELTMPFFLGVLHYFLAWWRVRRLMASV